MANDSFKIKKSLNLEPGSPTLNAEGDVGFNSSGSDLQFRDSGATRTAVSTDKAQTLTNKSIDADQNTITNIENADIKASAAIALDKLAATTASRALVSDGSGFVSASAVTATELGYVSGVTSAIQTQINAISFPAGMLVPYAGSAAPTGWLLCYGQEVSRSTYADLFTAISTTYGVGDGSTTFNLPDLRGRVPAGKDNMGGSAASRLTSTIMSPDGETLGATGGAQTHTLTTSEMPTHSHGVTDAGHNHTERGSSTAGGNTGMQLVANDGVNNNTVNSTASATTGITIDNSGSGNAHTNTQPTIILNYIIKH